MSMKAISFAVFTVLTATPVFAAAADKAPRLFPDAPPPPLIAASSLPSCCTTGGRLTLTQSDLSGANSIPEGAITEGAACEAKSSDGAIQAGKICY